MAAVKGPVLRLPSGKTHERRVFVTQAVVEPASQLRAHIRRRNERRKTRHRGEVWLHDVHAILIGMLEVEEEEGFVLLDRATQEKAALPPGEEWIIRNRGAAQGRISRDVVVAEVEVSSAMKI